LSVYLYHLVQDALLPFLPVTDQASPAAAPRLLESEDVVARLRRFEAEYLDLRSRFFAESQPRLYDAGIVEDQQGTLGQVAGDPVEAAFGDFTSAIDQQFGFIPPGEGKLGDPFLRQRIIVGLDAYLLGFYCHLFIICAKIMNFARITICNKMMDIKTGDKVRFLNSVGGGVVRRIQGKDRVWVEAEDGFEIPVLARELVVVESLDKQTYISRPKAPSPVEAPRPAPQPEEVKITETPAGERLNISLAYLPVDPKALQQSRYEAYFVNDSNYYLYFNYASRLNNSWTSRCNDLIEPNTKVFMEEFGKDELNAMERVCVQLIAFKKDKPYLLKNALSVELRIDTTKFYKLHCFVENDYFDEEALLFPVVRADAPERELLIPTAELQEQMTQKIRIDKPAPKPVRKKPEETIIEVDLHIGQLLDNTNGLAPGDILNHQLGKFHETLASYAGQKGRRIVFIHGKGEGVLRSAIEKELKTRYKQHTYQDASFREYGFGATMVTIH
jgi:hypothetical protein